MPVPQNPPRFSPALLQLFARMKAIKQSERMTALVDYLDDLRREFDWASAELKQLGFCAPCYLTEMERGDDHDCAEED